jgi:hypothetical protein
VWGDIVSVDGTVYLCQNLGEMETIKQGGRMSKNPAVYHYVKILRDAVTNPTKAYFFNSWDCANPKECRQYAISKLKTKFKYSDKAIMKLIDYSCESFDEQGFGKN